MKKLALVDRKGNSKSYVDHPGDIIPNSNTVDMGPNRVASQSTLKQQKMKTDDMLRHEPSIWSILEHSSELENQEQPLSKSHSPIRPAKGAHLPMVNAAHFPEFIRLKATLNHQFSIDSFGNEDSPHKKYPKQPLRK